MVTVELRKKGKNWRSEIKGKNVKKVKQDMGQRQSVEIDFGITFVSVDNLPAPQARRRGEEGNRSHLARNAGDRRSNGSREPTRGYQTRKFKPRCKVRSWLPSMRSLSPNRVIDFGSIHLASRFRTERETPEGPLEIRLVRFDKHPRAW